MPGWILSHISSVYLNNAFENTEYDSHNMSDCDTNDSIFLSENQRYNCPISGCVHIPNRTFLVRFGGISGEFGRAMVRILARRSRTKIPMERPNEPNMPPKRTKKVRLGLYRTQIQPKI